VKREGERERERERERDGEGEGEGAFTLGTAEDAVAARFCDALGLAPRLGAARRSAGAGAPRRPRRP
jgi:hypothetical protein